MEDISTAIARPCAVRLGDVMCNDSRTMARSGCKLSAEKENLLSAPRNKPNQGFGGTAALLSPGDNIGDDGSILSNQVDTEDSCISREYEEDGSVSFGGNNENSSPQSVASDISSISVEEVSGLEVDSERNSSTNLVGERNTSDVQDVKRVAVDVAGKQGNRFDQSDPKSSESFIEVPQQKKIRKTDSMCLFELNNIPLWGFTSICGRRPEMEDAVVAIPRFLQVPHQMLKVESASNGKNHYLSDSTAHFYGVYDGHGGCQVCFMHFCSVSLNLSFYLARDLCRK